MVVTEAEAERMLSCRVVVKKLTDEMVTRYRKVRRCTVVVKKCSQARRVMVYKATVKKASVIDGKIIKPALQIHPRLRNAFKKSYEKDPNCPSKGLTCVDCPKKFKNIRSLNSHWKSLHSGEYKFECSFCKKKFLNLHHFTTHERLHRNIMRFVCTICGKKFVRSPLLKHHYRADHSGRLECVHCDVTFACAKSLRHHLLEADKIFMCKWCKKMYSCYASLYRHMRDNCC